ncbi:hypothetical protein ACH4S8_23150 [Streptomyces sp. NPDC021080]|uniref:hypothetical protein n=1 Tax=Streptomyces sp. NPDC021080 TaxID=3365110 RepID=UPI0037B96E53
MPLLRPPEAGGRTCGVLERGVVVRAVADVASGTSTSAAQTGGGAGLGGAD